MKHCTCDGRDKACEDCGGTGYSFPALLLSKDRRRKRTLAEKKKDLLVTKLVLAMTLIFFSFLLLFTKAMLS